MCRYSLAHRHNGEMSGQLRALEASDERNRSLLKKLRKRKSEMQIFVKLPDGQLVVLDVVGAALA